MIFCIFADKEGEANEIYGDDSAMELFNNIDRLAAKRYV